MKKTPTAFLLILLFLTLLYACGGNKGHSDSGSSVGIMDCCESSVSEEDNGTPPNECCSADIGLSDKSTETENEDDPAVPDCCG